MRRILLLSVVILSSVISAIAQDRGEPKRDLRELMSPEEFQEAGLDKLSENELASLNGWLYGYEQVEPEAAVVRERPAPRVEPRPKTQPQTQAEPELTKEERFGREQVAAVQEEEQRREEERQADQIVSPILGDFKGWDGDTVFRLENGQVWKQVGDGSFYYPDDNPVAVIERGWFGSYKLSVQGFGSSVKVRRLK